MAGVLKYYYDKLVFTSTTSFTFFDSIGSSHLVNNLSKAGEIDENKSFDIHTIRFFAMLEAKSAGSEQQPISAVADFLEGIISLFIGGDPQLRVPAWMCPGGGGPVVQLYYSNQAQNMTLNGEPDPTKVFVLDPPITIPPDTSFKVMLDYAAAPALWSGAYPFMWMVLGGREY